MNATSITLLYYLLATNKIAMSWSMETGSLDQLLQQFHQPLVLHISMWFFLKAKWLFFF